MAVNLMRVTGGRFLTLSRTCPALASLHTPSASGVGGGQPSASVHGQPKKAQQQDKSKSIANRSWRVLKYDDNVGQAVHLEQSVHLPRINTPNDVLIKVHASSVNPIDVAMIHGYGHLLLSVSNYFMTSGIESLTGDRLPLTLGRDFVGTVVSRGAAVTQAKQGDLVWGTVTPFENGAHADYVVASEALINSKPTNLVDTDAAALPYAGVTAWSAINTFGGLDDLNTRGKRVLIFGGAGTVGSISIQMLKHWGAHVVATCSPRSMESLRQLTDVDELIDYNEVGAYLDDYPGTFDFILDCSATNAARKNYDALTKVYEREHSSRRAGGQPNRRVFDRQLTRYVTLSSPLLTNFDRYGLFAGMTSTLTDAISDTLSGLRYGLAFRWAYYLPNPKALEQIGQLVQMGVIKPYNVELFDFENALEAYTLLDEKQLKSKVVFSFENNK